MPFDAETPHTANVELTAVVYNSRTGETHVVKLALTIDPERDALKDSDRETAIRRWSLAWARALA